MVDPFSSLSTQINTPALPETTVQLVPMLPPPVLDINTNTPKVDVMDQIEIAARQLPTLGMGYTFGEPEKKRYDNPVIGYIPSNRLVGVPDIEELYSINQPGTHKLMNGALKGIATAGGTFFSEFLSMPSMIDLVRQGKPIEAFTADSTFGGVQNWLKGLEDTLPNYYTMAERENPWKGIVPFTDGSANFWGDKVIKNIGFSIGALGAGIVIDAGISALTLGAGGPAITAGLLARYGSKMHRAFRNMTKVLQTADGANELGRAYRTSYNMSRAANTLAVSRAITKAPQMIATSVLTAQGEAFIEGYHNYAQLREKEIAKALREGVNIASDLEERSQKVGKYTTVMNLPIIMASNFIQFKNLLHGYRPGLGVPRSFIKTNVTDGGLSMANNFTFKKGAVEFLKDMGKNFSTEFFQEGGQVLVGNSVLDYYSDKKNYESKKSVLDFVFSQIPKNISGQDFWLEGVIGGITGALMGGRTSLRYMTKGREKTQEIIDNMNPVIQRFNGLVKNFNHQITLQSDPSNRDVQFKSMYSIVSDNIKQGTFEVFQDTLQDLKAVELDSFNLMFNTDFKTEAEKLNHIQGIISQVEGISNDIEVVERMYPDNPYVKSSTLGRLVNQLFPDANSNKLAALFEDFKENMGYTMARMRVVNERQGMLNTYFRGVLSPEIGESGIQSVINYFGAISREGNKRPYFEWKNVQLEGLRDQLQYYDALIDKTDPASVTRDVKTTRKSIENRIKEIEAHLEKVRTLKGQDLYSEILNENVSAVDQLEFQENVLEFLRNQAENKNLQQEAQNPEVVAEATAKADALSEDIADDNFDGEVVEVQEDEDLSEDEMFESEEELEYEKEEEDTRFDDEEETTDYNNTAKTFQEIVDNGVGDRKNSNDLFTITQGENNTVRVSIQTRKLNKDVVQDYDDYFTAEVSGTPSTPSTSDAKADIEQESTPGDYVKVLQLVRDIIAGKKIDTPEQLQLHRNYPKLFEEYMKIETRRQEELKKVGEEVLPEEVQEFITIDNSGGKVKPEYTPVPGKDLKTILVAWFKRNIPDVIIGSIKFNGDAFDVEIKIKGIKNFQTWSLPIISTVGGTGQFIESNLSEWGKTLINAKYDAGLTSLGTQPATPGATSTPTTPTTIADIVQTYEFKGKTQTLRKKVSTKDGVTKITFVGERSDKPGAVIGGSGYVYGGPTSNSVQQFFDDYGITVEDIAEDLSIDNIKAIKVLEERTGEGKTAITFRITYSEEMGGMSSEPMDMSVKKQKFTSDAEVAALKGKQATPSGTPGETQTVDILQGREFLNPGITQQIEEGELELIPAEILVDNAGNFVRVISPIIIRESTSEPGEQDEGEVETSASSNERKILNQNEFQTHTVENVTFGTGRGSDVTNRDNHDAVYVDNENGKYIIADGYSDKFLPFVPIKTAVENTIKLILGKSDAFTKTFLDVLHEAFQNNNKITLTDAIVVLKKAGFVLTSVQGLNPLINYVFTAFKNSRSSIEGSQTRVSAIRINRTKTNTYNIRSNGINSYAVINDKNEIVTFNGYDSKTSPKSFTFTVFNKKPSIINQRDYQERNITLNPGESLIATSSFISTKEQLQEFLNLRYGLPQDENVPWVKKSDVSFIRIDYSDAKRTTQLEEEFDSGAPLGEVTDEEYEKFEDEGFVSNERLNSIASKIVKEKIKAAQAAQKKPAKGKRPAKPAAVKPKTFLSDAEFEMYELKKTVITALVRKLEAESIGDQFGREWTLDEIKEYLVNLGAKGSVKVNRVSNGEVKELVFKLGVDNNLLQVKGRRSIKYSEGKTLNSRYYISKNISKVKQTEVDEVTTNNVKAFMQDRFQSHINIAQALIKSKLIKIEC